MLIVQSKRGKSSLWHSHQNGINTRNLTQTLALTQTLTQTLTLTLTQTLTLTLTLYDQNHMLIIKYTNFIDFWIGVP
jgi:hypothetical protein